MTIAFRGGSPARARLPAQKAIYEACLVRFGRSMMTTMAALAGTFPIALGFGAGGEARRPPGPGGGRRPGGSRQLLTLLHHARDLHLHGEGARNEGAKREELVVA